MALTQAQKDELFAALDAADGSDQQATLLRVASKWRVADVAPALREYTHILVLRQQQTMRVIRAMDAVFDAVRDAGVATPGDLRTLRGYATMPELLASLCFTGDLDALAAEMEGAVRRMA